MAKQHLRLILNGKSASRDDVRRAVETLRATGHQVSVRVTWEVGDAPRLAREALARADQEGITTLVAGGGDGTINEVVSAVLENIPDGRKPPFEFAVLPLGTANDFACGIGLDPADPLACLRFASRTKGKPTDIGLVNGRAFVNMATGGFGARVTTETDPNLKRLLGGAAYLFTGLNRFSDLASSEGRITSDDFTWEGAFLALAIGNGRQSGGGVELCPDAVLDDGFLDLTIVPYPNAGDVADILGRLIEFGPEGLRDKLVMRKVRNLTIEADHDLQFNLDGEPIHGRELSVSVKPGQVDFKRS
ncbi:lipid kinase YegS [Roseibium sp. RKSG952]|uniref:lipid kinase YegS n=1 Tax=Roseibium sp. RKSG952 TaxID=2529384 RepID=UPI0012BC8EBA|nr:lipid kinase YegS [Roseibium sp. RKSG952]MTH97009.1 lipid kinase YegS [Roseibium sp. RKSG952]